MAWGKAGSTTLSSGGDLITVDSLSNNKCIMILNHVFSSGQGKLEPKLNNDGTVNYTCRYGLDGATDAQLTSSTDFENTTGGFTNGSTFHAQYLVNIATEEKLLISHSCEVETTGTSGVPRYRQYVGKWRNTTDAVSRYDVPNVGTGAFKTGSNSTVIGSDMTPAAAVSFPTNVQLGSRAEITDTRKIYSLSNMSTSGLKAYYNFDSIDSSTTLTNQATTGDGLGSSADGTVTNATLDTTNEKLGTGCYNFDGTGDKVALGSSTTTLNFLTTGNSDWTVSFWMKLNATEPGGNNAILCQGQGNEAGLDILFDDRSGESRDHVLGVRLEGNSGNTAMKLYTSAQFIPKDTDWHHYVITGDVSTRTVTAYRDGGNAESDSTGSGSFPTSLAQKPTFGVHPTSSFSGADLNAKLDDCSLWSRILTSDEISLLYNSGTGATPYTTKTWREIGA